MSRHPAVHPIGAGLDTFAYRQATWTHDLAIVEIDHPASQQFNVAILSRAGVAVPGNLRFLAIDFGVDAAAGSVIATRLRKWQHLA